MILTVLEVHSMKAEGMSLAITMKTGGFDHVWIRFSHLITADPQLEYIKEFSHMKQINKNTHNQPSQ